MKRLRLVSGVIVLFCAVTSTASAQGVDYDAHWTKQTHSNHVEPCYKELFTEGVVRRIDIKVDSVAWSAAWADLGENLGFGKMNMRGNMGEGPVLGLSFTPLWIPCTVSYNGAEWHQVGMRFKGNSSIMQGYQMGNKKLSIKLDFDQFEDQYPELKNQRFYGFKQLNLNNCFNDTSFIHEMVASQLFREFGMVAARATPCELYVDYGEGSKYYGLYTIVEEVDDSVVKSNFEKSKGNLYKPDDGAGSFAEGGYDTDEFNLKSGGECDYSDVNALYTLLHNPLRESNPQAWRDSLESIFDVDTFLKWLAVSVTIQNWDSYGNMAHNYFLYSDPESGKLVWIPWDHNETFQDGRRALEPNTLGAVGREWPLINYIISMDEYKAKYDGYLREFVDEIFTPAKMAALYDSYYNLLKEYVYREVTARTYMSYYREFDESIETLKSHVTERGAVVESYLANPVFVEQGAFGAMPMGRGQGGRGGQGGQGEGGDQMRGGGGAMSLADLKAQAAGGGGDQRPQMGMMGGQPPMGEAPMAMMGGGQRPMGEPSMGMMPDSLAAMGGGFPPHAMMQQGGASSVVEGEPLPMEGVQRMRF